jgi:hypothetical protein
MESDSVRALSDISCVNSVLTSIFTLIMHNHSDNNVTK